jgi:hypothetical protein
MLREFLRLAVYLPVDEASQGSGLTVASDPAVQEIMRVIRAFDFAGSVGTYRAVAQISGCADTFTRSSKWTGSRSGCRENGSRPLNRSGYDPRARTEKEDDHGPRPRRRGVLLSPPASAAGGSP